MIKTGSEGRPPGWVSGFQLSAWRPLLTWSHIHSGPCNYFVCMFCQEQLGILKSISLPPNFPWLWLNLLRPEMHQNPAAATFKGSSRASDPQPFPTVSPERGAVLRFSRSVLCELGQVAWGGTRDHKRVLKLVTAGDFRLVSKLLLP